MSESSFSDNELHSSKVYLMVNLKEVNQISSLDRYVDPHPFVPSNLEERTHRCDEIFHIQSAGLAKRFKHTGAKKAIIGISGGLDSTLALLVIVEAFKKLNNIF